MVNGMANRETSELGGEGIALCPEGLISWLLTPILGERGVIVKRGCHCRAVIMWGGSIRENEFLIFSLACLEVAMSVRVMRPASSDARGVARCCCVSRCILPFQKRFEEC